MPRPAALHVKKLFPSHRGSKIHAAKRRPIRFCPELGSCPFSHPIISLISISGEGDSVVVSEFDAVVSG
jgi:hypothetical protein